jgi:hypothetical protein
LKRTLLGKSPSTRPHVAGHFKRIGLVNRGRRVELALVRLIGLVVNVVGLVDELLVVVREPSRQFRLGGRRGVLWLRASAAHVVKPRGLIGPPYRKEKSRALPGTASGEVGPWAARVPITYAIFGVCFRPEVVGRHLHALGVSAYRHPN